jgi:hypothetical protein
MRALTLMCTERLRRSKEASQAQKDVRRQYGMEGKVQGREDGRYAVMLTENPTKRKDSKARGDGKDAYVTGDGKEFPSVEAALAYANDIYRKSGRIISVEMKPKARGDDSTAPAGDPFCDADQPKLDTLLNQADALSRRMDEVDREAARSRVGDRARGDAEVGDKRRAYWDREKQSWVRAKGAKGPNGEPVETHTWKGNRWTNGSGLGIAGGGSGRNDAHGLHRPARKGKAKQRSAERGDAEPKLTSLAQKCAEDGCSVTEFVARAIKAKLLDGERPMSENMRIASPAYNKAARSDAESSTWNVTFEDPEGYSGTKRILVTASHRDEAVNKAREELKATLPKHFQRFKNLKSITRIDAEKRGDAEGDRRSPALKAGAEMIFAGPIHEGIPDKAKVKVVEDQGKMVKVAHAGFHFTVMKKYLR